MSILKKLGNTKVVSDDGRELRIQFRSDYIAYMENKHTLYIGMKRVGGEGGRTFIRIDAKSGFTDWLPPHAEEHLTLYKKMEIVTFIEKALKLLDYDFEISNNPCNKIKPSRKL